MSHIVQAVPLASSVRFAEHTVTAQCSVAQQVLAADVPAFGGHAAESGRWAA